MQGTPTRAMAGDDMADIEGPQPGNRVGDELFHDSTEMQPSHNGMDRGVSEKAPGVRAHIDNARMRAGAEDDQPQPPDPGHEHALVHQQGVRLPRSLRSAAGQMVVAALLEGGDPRNFSAVIEVAIK